jgi:hypothetical protein
MKLIFEKHQIWEEFLGLCAEGVLVRLMWSSYLVIYLCNIYLSIYLFIYLFIELIYLSMSLFIYYLFNLFIYFSPSFTILSVYFRVILLFVA